MNLYLVHQCESPPHVCYTKRVMEMCYNNNLYSTYLHAVKPKIVNDNIGYTITVVPFFNIS